MLTAKCRDGRKRGRKRCCGFSVFDILVWIFLVASFVAIIFNVVWPRVQAWKIKSTISSEFSAIMAGLENYYQSNYAYPAGNGWGWNVNEAYVPQDVINKGWQYQCAANTMVITTPPITSAKARTALAAEFQRPCDAVFQSGTSLVCQLNDRPCR
ncbi:hypothetical protein [Thermosulfurimonas sp. F29]|uniref:hypothetical protein n=1 Tax=Thermosulfurimonas sp. F29 TaxID=2867247 RepID=UPI001C82BEE9|nr:hypothetical protein [Thermosulfurimonas sp. F29]MBX6424195.1 hypothetical protein [Thermosulfurimonas sp. F29]